MLSELTPDIIEYMLVNQYFGRIGCAAENRILIEPVMYYYDGHSYLYGLTRPGAKTQLLHKNPQVAFEIDELMSKDSWRSVIVEGVYEELTDGERDYALFLLRRRTLPLFADERLVLSEECALDDPKDVCLIVYRICINSKTGRCYQRYSDHDQTVADYFV